MYHATGATGGFDVEVTVRRAGDADTRSLLALAALDDAEPLSGSTLVAELSGEAVAAVSLADGRCIADPFVRTADIVALLELRASQLSMASGARDERGGWVAALRAAIAR